MTLEKLRTQEELKQWLQEALVRAARTQSELADGVGVSRQAVHGWLKTGKITIGSLRKAEAFLGENSPVSKGIVNDNIYAVTKGGRMGSNVPTGVLVPITTWNSIAKDDDVVEVIGSIVCPAPHSINTYALKIGGESMDTIFALGDMVFVDKDRKPINGDYVVVQLEDDEESILRKYRKEAGKIYLTASNDTFDQIIIDKVEPILICGVVIGSYKPIHA